MEGFSARWLGLTTALLAAVTGCGDPSSSTDSRGSAPPTSRSSAPPSLGVDGDPTSRNAPPAREGAAMAFDPLGKRMIMFGGIAQFQNTTHPADILHDTWAWDGHSWTSLQPAHSPPGLFGAALVLDPVSNRLILMSGVGATSAKGAPLQQGMWAWDGEDWSRVGDNPLQVPFPSAVADPVHRQIVLAGFDAGLPSVCAPRDCPDTTAIDGKGAYVWNGTVWTPAPGQGNTGTTSLPILYAPGAAFDPVSKRVIVTGGSGQMAQQNTFAWNGGGWSQVAVPATADPDPNLPDPGSGPAATDGAGGRVILQAGSATWTFDGTTWKRLIGANPPATGGTGTVLAYDPDVKAIVMFGGASGSSAADSATSNAMYRWSGTDWVAIPTS